MFNKTKLHMENASNIEKMLSRLGYDSLWLIYGLLSQGV
jgi:hypothetical protein